MAKVLLFGPLADVLNTGSIEIELGEQTHTILALITQLAEKGPQWQQNLSPEKLQITINRQFADAHSKITNADEIAFISLPGSV